MKWRYFLLIFVLLFRFSLGWLELDKYTQKATIKVTGNIDNIYQKDTECIIIMGRFWINFRSPCSFPRQAKVEIVGRINGGVIDKFLGRLWLDSAELVVLDDEVKVGVKSSSFLDELSVLREKIVNVYRRFLPDAESSLVAGIVLGYKNDIGQKMYEMMVKSGTIHIAVASGYNIMLVGGTVLSVCFWFCRRKWASVLAVVVMLVYALEAGGEPPVVRAVIMAAIVFWGAVLGRKAASWWVLLVTGWLMILMEPLLFINVSFQLSMMASVGLMIIEPWMTKKMSTSHEKLGEVLSGSGFLTSIATMITTAPIIWWHFGRMSWIGIVSNILILPLIPILMISGALMQVLPWVFSWPTYVIAHWMVMVIRFWGS